MKPTPPEHTALIAEVIPRTMGDAELAKHADALDKLIRIDMPRCGEDYKDYAVAQAEVFAVLRWACGDAFWSTVFNSIPRLRVDYSLKFWNMRGQWQRAKPKRSESVG